MEFTDYLSIGLQHILDPQGYDHILFVISLCAVYQLKDWKKVAWLVTAFTLGHSLTLALAILRIVSFNSEVIELLIPITILITCFVNFFHKPEAANATWKVWLRFLLACGFGLIHGLGFSNFLRSMLGKEGDLFLPLLAFNVGLEIGQLAIVLFVLSSAYLFISIFRTKPREWILAVSGIVAGVSLKILEQNWI
ncbi:MAG: HupE/UreJ family protein [Verrucomicrobia bacterium]|nr:HupE/UreJ family protein [Cytophagales bacterium]